MANISKLDLQKSYSRVRSLAEKTPLLTGTFLDDLWDCKVCLKLEQLQPIGAFKIRGASNFCIQLNRDELKNGIVTHSSGNHAQAVSYVANKMGIKSWVVMPENANKHKVTLAKKWGAEVIFCKPTIQDREATANACVEKYGAVLVPPFDHNWIIAGQATAAMEIFAETKDLDMIIAPLGGGGLLAGTSLSAKYFSQQTKVIGAEPVTADDGLRGFKTGERVTHQQTNTVADGLRTTVGAVPFPLIKSYVEDIWLADEEEIVKWMFRFWEETKMIIEPSSAVPLAAIEANKDKVKGKKIAVIITGGNVDFNHLPSRD